MNQSAGRQPEGKPCKPAASHHDLDLNSARILLVDDHAEMRELLQELLGQYWAVEAYADGMTALESATRNPPSLVLADVIMPGMDGLELLRRLRANPDTSEIPIILISGKTDEDARVDGIEAGADDYIVKPFPPRELLARIRTHLKLSHLRREAERRTARQNAILSGITQIFRAAMTCRTEMELSRVCLAVAEEVTQSKFGFIGEVSSRTGKMMDIAVSDPSWEAHQMRVCSGHGKVSPISAVVYSLFGRALDEGKGFFTNDLSSLLEFD